MRSHQWSPTPDGDRSPVSALPEITGTTASAPAITVNQGSINIVALNGNSLGTEFCWAANGSTTWHPDALPGFDTGAPAITTYPGGVHVVNTTFFATVGDETAANGTGTWQWTSGSGPELTATDAAVTTNNGIENIAVISGDGNLYFYWQYSPGQYTRELVDTSASSDPPGRQRDGSGTIRDG